MEKKDRVIEFTVLDNLVGNLGDKRFVLQDRKAILTARLVDACGGWTAYKSTTKSMRERRDGEDEEEEDSYDGDSGDKSQNSRM